VLLAHGLLLSLLASERRPFCFLAPLLGGCEARFRHLAALRELNLLLSERLLLSQLLVELLRNLALEAVEGGAEVVQDVSGAVAVSRSVVREVHWVLNHEVILVHLR